MLLSSIRQALAALLVAFLVSACGGSGGAAPPPTGGVTVTPGDGAVTVTWNAQPGVKYWIFYAPLSGNFSSITTDNWTQIPGSVAVLNVTSPYVVTGLSNGFTYAFTVNGRTGDGPGGPGTPSVSSVPRPAGASWQTLANVGSNTLRGITYGTSSADLLGYYLTVGDSGAAYRSVDGVTWSGLDVSGGATLNAATYTFGNFIAAGPGGLLRYSTDMGTWTTAASNTTQNLNAIASNGALAIAVGDNGTIIESANGSAWVTVTNLPTTKHLYGIAYSASGVWTAVGAGGTVLVSADGGTWSLATSGTTATLRAVAVQTVVTSMILATGDNGTAIASADNGATWTTRTTGTTANLLTANANTSQFLATGQGGVVITSTDSVTWTTRSSSTVADLYAAISGLAQYLVVGQGGTEIRSQ